jgi:hypothetical protein
MVDERNWPQLGREDERSLWLHKVLNLESMAASLESAMFYSRQARCYDLQLAGFVHGPVVQMDPGDLRTHHAQGGPSDAFGKSVNGSCMSNFLERRVASGDLCTPQEGAGRRGEEMQTTLGNQADSVSGSKGSLDLKISCSEPPALAKQSARAFESVIGSCMSNFLEKRVASGDLCTPQEGAGRRGEEMQTTLGNQADSVSGSGGSFDLQISCSKPPALAEEWRFPRKTVKPSSAIHLNPSRRQRSRWAALLLDESGLDEEVPGIRNSVSVPSLFGARDNFFETAAENLPSASKKKTGLAPVAPKPSDDELLEAAIAEIGVSGTCMSNFLEKESVASGDLCTHHESAEGNSRSCDHPEASPAQGSGNGKLAGDDEGPPFDAPENFESDKASPLVTTIPPEILDECPLELRERLIHHVLKGGLGTVEMGILERSADEGSPCAKAFLKVACQAKAYLAKL